VDPDGAVLEQTLFTYDGPRLVEQQRVEPRSGARVTTTWEYEPNAFVPVAQTRRRQDAITDEFGFHAIVADLVGAPRELVAADGTLVPLASHDLWGRPTGGPADEDHCPLRFPGQYFDAETGLHYNLHRFYDPQLAGYLSPDPLGLIPGPNPRAYAANPLTESDPLGLNGEGGAFKPDVQVPAPNVSNSTRVEYGLDPMSKLAIQARKSEQWTRGGRNVAVFLYHDEHGKAGAFAALSDGTHSERLDWKVASEGYGVRKDQLDKLYTELQPCSGKGMPNCDRWVSKNFPGVPVSHSFDYGPDAASRRAAMSDLAKALTQIRKGNLPKS
jgi:RHS repeat-associated protein